MHRRRHNTYLADTKFFETPESPAGLLRADFFMSHGVSMLSKLTKAALLTTLVLLSGCWPFFPPFGGPGGGGHGGGGNHGDGGHGGGPGFESHR